MGCGTSALDMPPSSVAESPRSHSAYPSHSPLGSVRRMSPSHHLEDAPARRSTLTLPLVIIKSHLHPAAFTFETSGEDPLLSAKRHDILRTNTLEEHSLNHLHVEDAHLNATHRPAADAGMESVRGAGAMSQTRGGGGMEHHEEMTRGMVRAGRETKEIGRSCSAA
jgi:hypothetical protein